MEKYKHVLVVLLSILEGRLELISLKTDLPYIFCWFSPKNRIGNLSNSKNTLQKVSGSLEQRWKGGRKNPASWRTFHFPLCPMAHIILYSIESLDFLYTIVKELKGLLWEEQENLFYRPVMCVKSGFYLLYFIELVHACMNVYTYMHRWMANLPVTCF